jgi:hypothetical protein
MAAGKYIDIVTGVLTQVSSVDTSAGFGDAGKLVALNASGQIDGTMIAGGGVLTAATAQAIAAGDLCYVTPTGTIDLAKADNIATLAQGFSLAGGAFPGTATIQFAGENTGVSGLTPVGGTFYLSAATSGKITTTPPATPTQYVQPVGFAVSATELHFAPLSAVIVV